MQAAEAREVPGPGQACSDCMQFSFARDDQGTATRFPSGPSGIRPSNQICKAPAPPRETSSEQVSQ